MRPAYLSLAWMWSLGLLTSAPALAFDPPVNTTGPLTLRIAGPREPVPAGAPIAIQLQLESTADTPLHGTVRLAVIDDWQVRPPATLPFSLHARGRVTFDFTLTANQHSYNALYPVHAFAEFRSAGQPLAAHAVLVLTATNPDPPRPNPPPYPWRPYPFESELSLQRLPVRRSIVNVFGREPQSMPTGWQGADPDTLAHCDFNTRPNRGGQVRSAIAVHPPYRNGHPGTVAIQYPVQLPPGAPIRLRFATAIRDHEPARGEPPSDGVTFRVRIMPFAPDPPLTGGDLVHERHSDSKTWQEADIDLSRYAGQSIIIQLESDPGPKQDTTCDFCYWSEPILSAGPAASAEGPTSPPFHPVTTIEPVGNVGATQRAWQVRVWPGPRGLLDAVFGFDDGQQRLCFRGLHVSVSGDDLASPASVCQFLKLSRHEQPGTYRYVHTFRAPSGEEFDLLITVLLNGPALQLQVALDRLPPPQPWRVTYISDVAAGEWTERVRHVYAGAGNVIRDPQAFALGFDGHQLSTSFVGFDFANGISLVQAVNVVPDRLEIAPDAKRYTLHSPHAQTLTFIPAANVWDGARAWHDLNGLRAAGGVEKLAGRFVFDYWGGDYAGSAKQLERSFRYGLTNSLVVWHNWQRHGYDNRLPDIWPPNPRLGTLDQFTALAKLCKTHGVLFAPHDNYIDYYPDADGFSYQHIAFTAGREPIKAWFNPGPQAQSYRWRADHVRPCVERNLKLIRADVAPDAFFVDVWSSIQPYDFWTHDGQFHDRQTTNHTWGELFAWIRDYLGNDAPQISESGHDTLIGYLDGAQANHLRVGRPLAGGTDQWCLWDIRCTDAERIPWFDAAHHDRFVHHGAGYDPRYRAGLDAQKHGMYSDDYIATEVLTAHPAMVDRPFGHNVVRKYYLLEELLRRLALARLDSLDFDHDNLHRQHVRWTCLRGQADVWVNRGHEDWLVAGHTLPEYGWFARVQDGPLLFEATVERLHGRTVEWAGHDLRSCYVNARAAAGNPPTTRPAAPTQLVTFGAIRTDGAFRFESRDRLGGLTITPLPDEPARTIRIDLKAANVPPSTWKTLQAVDEADVVQKSSPVTLEGDTLILRTEPGVFAYRLSP